MAAALLVYTFVETAQSALLKNDLKQFIIGLGASGSGFHRKRVTDNTANVEHYLRC